MENSLRIFKQLTSRWIKNRSQRSLRPGVSPQVENHTIKVHQSVLQMKGKLLKEKHLLSHVQNLRPRRTWVTMFYCKRIKCFPSTLLRRNLKTSQSQLITDHFASYFVREMLCFYLTPKYLFGLNKSLHLLETHCALLN